MKKKTILGLTIIAMIIIGLSLTGCGCSKSHNYSENWSSNDLNHWHECEDEKCDEKIDYAAHSFDEGVITINPTEEATGEKTFTCTVCGYKKTEVVPKITHIHTAGTTWLHDATKHWNECSCGHVMNEEEHKFSETVTVQPDAGTYGEKMLVCTVCNYEKSEPLAKKNQITYSGSELSKVYDGTAVAVDLSDISVLSGATPTLEWYEVDANDNKTKIDSAPINAGTYNLVIVVAGNDEWEEATLSKDVVISKKTGDVNVTKDLNKVYDGKAVVLSDSEIEGNSDNPSYTITWYASSTADPNYILADAPKNAGNYTVKVEMAETNNVSKDSFTFSFEIEKRTLRFGQTFSYGTTDITNSKYLMVNENYYDGSDEKSKPTNKIADDYIVVCICFDDVYVGSSLNKFVIDENMSSGSDNKTDYLNYVLDTEVAPAIIPKKLTNLELTTVYNGENGRTDFVLTSADGIVGDEDVRVNITGNQKWNALNEFKLSLTDTSGYEVISLVEAGDYANYSLSLSNGSVGKITITQKVLTNLQLKTYENSTAGRTNFALSTADGIVNGDKVFVNISGDFYQEWTSAGEIFDLVLNNPNKYPEEKISLVENEYSSNYILVETDELVGTIEILDTVVLNNITFKASEGTSFKKGTTIYWKFNITSEMGLEAGDSVTLSFVTIASTGKISLTNNNATISSEKYVLGSGCYVDLDN